MSGYRNDIVLQPTRFLACRRESKQLVQWCVSAAVLAGPDPIEMPFSKVKAFESSPSGQQADRLVVPTIGRAECRNYFRHAGHASI